MALASCLITVVVLVLCHSFGWARGGIAGIKKQKNITCRQTTQIQKKDKPVFQSLSMIVTASRAPEGCAEGAEFSGLGFQSFVFHL